MVFSKKKLKILVYEILMPLLFLTLTEFIFLIFLDSENILKNTHFLRIYLTLDDQSDKNQRLTMIGL